MSNTLVVVNKTLEMLRDRKYRLPRYLRNNVLTEEDIINMFNKKGEAILYAKERMKDGSKKKIMVFFSTSKFGKKEVREKLVFIKKNNIHHVIFVLENKFTRHGKNLLEKTENLTMQILTFNDMSINPTKHELVPRHVLLTDSETKKFIAIMGKKIPIIKKNDRIARHYNAKIGQIFKIYRDRELYWRIVAK